MVYRQILVNILTILLLYILIPFLYLKFRQFIYFSYIYNIDTFTPICMGIVKKQLVPEVNLLIVSLLEPAAFYVLSFRNRSAA